MRKFHLFTATVALAGTIALQSCMDKDVYDPGKEKPAIPVENPLGSDFQAPDGFDWSMINSVNLAVEVKDEFNGQYNYLIEVFTTNPLTDATVTPIAAGIAKQGSNFTAEINVPKTNDRLFICQTDPKQRKELYECEVPENGGAMNCKLYYVATNTRAAGSSTSAFEAAMAKGIVEPPHTKYKENEIFSDIPTESSKPIDEWNPNTFTNGAKFIISDKYTDQNPFTKNIQVQGGRMSIYVKGVWRPTSLQEAFDIYVLDGGKIIATNDLTIGSQTNLSIQSQGKVEIPDKFNIQSISTKNFGTITARNITMNQTKQELYNENIIDVSQTLYLNGVSLFNYGRMRTNQLNLTDSKILNRSNIDSQTDISMNGGQIFNYGNITFNESNGKLSTNNSTATAVINHHEATVKGYHWDGGASLYNDGFIEVSKCKNTSTDVFYNSCTFIIKEEFTFEKLILDKGSVTGGRANLSSQEWLPIPTVRCIMPTSLTLKNGSMLKANQFILDNSVNTIVGEGEDISMLKVKKMILNNGGDTYMRGNLVFESTTVDDKRSTLRKEASVISTGFDESKYTIETCGGIFNEGNEGESPKDPTFPIITEDATGYTFAFEDRWPIYGDFDMNDVVVTIDNIKIYTNPDNSVKEFKLDGTVRAVGASITLGVGISFLKLPVNAAITELKGSVGTSGSGIPAFEPGQSKPVIILCNDVHRFMGNDKDDKAFINTVKDSPYNTPDGADFDISMKFDGTSVKPEFFNINNLDVFIITKAVSKNTKRTEVHVAGYAPTDLASKSQFQNGNDDSSDSNKKYYLSNENLAWGVVIPGNFSWPLEQNKITTVYEQFEGWITSGGQNNKDWYNYHNGNVISNK